MNTKIFTVFRKEIKDSFRDRRTLISSILIPALLVPVLFLFMGHSMSGVENNVKKEGFKIAVSNKSYLSDYLGKISTLKIVTSSDPEKDLKDGKIQAFVITPENFNSNIDNEKLSDISIKYDATNSKTQYGISYLQSAIDSFSKSIASYRLEQKGINPNIIHPVNTKLVTVSNDNGVGAMVMSFLIPFFLMIWPAIGAMISASDTGAGEKERGTLEPLLATQASRTSIAIGKWLSISVSSILGVIAFIIGFSAAAAKSPEIFGGKISISASATIMMIFMCILISLMYSAMMLALSVFARNVKEAGTYMSPINILAMVPAYLTIYADVKLIPTWQYAIPFYNIVLVLKESLLGPVNPVHALMTISWSIILIIVSLSLAIKMYNSESVVFRS